MNWSNRHRILTDETAISEATKIIAAIEPEKTLINLNPQDNKIYLYGDINRESILNLNRQIDDLTKHLRSLQLNYNLIDIPAIEIHISSDGGEIFPAMASVDKIINNSIPIHTFCEGIVASAGTLISAVGKKRFITKNSCMLVHQVSSGLWGNYAEFKEEVQNLDLIMKLIKTIYLKHTKFKAKELEELLTHDLVLSAEDCLKSGLVDKIL